MEFLKNTPRFSFLYGGKPFTECSYEATQELRGNEVITTYRFEDGLKVTNIAKKYEKYGAWEWVNYLENVGTENTQIISELWDCDATFSMSHEEKSPASPWTPSKEQVTYVMNPNGSTTVDEYDFYTHVDDSCKRKSFLFAEQKEKEYKCIGGRSSDGNAPFFNVHQAGRGYFFGIGWTGQWNAKIARKSDGLSFQSKIEDTYFYLKPGEKIRTSSIVILPYEASVEDSQNLWRRFLREEITPIASRGATPPFCAGFWGGTESSDLIRRIKIIDEAGIPFNHFWIDAGWYGRTTEPSRNEFSGDWGSHTGDWEVSPLIHPNGMKDVSDAIHQCGRRFVFWFEPERVRYSTEFAQQHPEYLIKNKFKENDHNLLLNLGDPAAFEYIATKLCEMIEDLHVDWYRQDFNFQPLDFWRSNDEENRRGITEIKHIMGMYRLWDLLLDRFPHLMIDNCASGGKRLDVETLRRSVPLWRSDAQCPADPIPELTQANHMNFSLWMPYSGTSPGRLYDTYRMRSSYAPCMSSNYSYSADEHFGENPAEIAWLKAHSEEYLRIRPYFDEDVYHLTPPTRDDMTWCGVQWHRPESGDGMIQIFKREHCIYPEAHFTLRKIDTAKTYRFTDIDGGTWEVSGKELTENGFSLRIEENRVAKIYFYEVTR